MLGFSLPKILVLVAIISLVWYGFKIFGRSRELDKSIQKGDVLDGNEEQNLDMEECLICKAYVVPGEVSCRNKSCPFPSG